MLIALASLLVPAMVEIVEIDVSLTEEMIIVNNTCHVIVKKIDRQNNYPKVEQQIMKECFGDEIE